MITFTTATTQQQLQGILQLQKANLARNLEAEEIRSQGFVTVDHTYEQLKKLNDRAAHIIALDGEKIIGYLLAMTEDCKFDLPVLVPMFQVFETITYKERKITDYRYLVVGQVCMDKAYRGRGILDQCYAAYRSQYESSYDFAITEIALANTRSLNAHKRVGFQDIHHYSDPEGTEWVIVLWDWNRDN